VKSMIRNRREFLANTTAALLTTSTMSFAAPGQDPAWDQLPALLARIKPPIFPKRDFEITKYGALSDGKKDCTDAIAQAIAACNRAGGGRVVVPVGAFLTGAIHLKSNVNLYVSSGATLKFIPDPKKYLPVVLTRYEGTELMNYSPFIYADGQENLGITGEGTLDGQCTRENWWSWGSAKPWGLPEGKPRVDDRVTLTDMGNRDIRGRPLSASDVYSAT
jgi:polygalacturonase